MPSSISINKCGIRYIIIWYVPACSTCSCLLWLPHSLCSLQTSPAVDTTKTCQENFNRAKGNLINYFHWRYIFTLSCLVYKTSENSENCRSQLPRTQSNAMKCLVLSEQHFKTHRDSIYYKVRQGKAANLHFWEAETIEMLD